MASEPINNIPERVSIRSLVDLLMEVCRVAIECGCSSNRVEALVTRLGEAWGFQVDAAALPTAVWLSVKGRGQHIMELVRVKSWGINLSRLSQLNDLVDDVESRKIYLDEAFERLKNVSEEGSPYPKWLRYAAGGGSSVAIVSLYKGVTPTDLAVAFFLGIVCQVISRFFTKENRKFLAEFFAAFIVALMAASLKFVIPEVELARVIIGGLISLFPGLVFVNALHEVAQKNLASGSARFLEACMIAVSLSFGVASALGFVHYVIRRIS